MERAEYIRLKRKVEAEWRKAEAEYRKKREALEIVYALANEGSGQPELPDPPEAKEPAPSPTSVDEPETNGGVRHASPKVFSGSFVKRTRIPILQEVRSLTWEIENDITQSVITQMLSDKYPDAHVVPSSVSGALKRLLDAGELELVREGYGAEPNAYRRALRDDLSQESPMNEENSVRE